MTTQAPPTTPVQGPPSGSIAPLGLSTRSQIAAAYSGLGLIVVVVIGFLLIAGYLPPVHANDTAQEMADFYRDDTDRIRLGLVITFCGWAPWAALTTVISVQLARMQPRRPVLPMLQLVTGAGGWIFLSLSAIILIVASFRPERPIEITQALHDLGWICLFITVPAFSFQALVIGVATLRRDPPVQVYPRWFGYANIWVAILFVPALFLPFFKTGPFASQGALVYWLAFVVFFIWIIMMFVVIRRAALDEARDEHAVLGD